MKMKKENSKFRTEKIHSRERNETEIRTNSTAKGREKKIKEQ